MPPFATTFLFTPAHDARKVSGALASSADAVILDLEDSVPPAQKAEARAAIAALVASHPADPSTEIWVRVNAAGPDFDADVSELPVSLLAGVVLPKAEDPARIEALAAAGAKRVLLLVESAAGLHDLERLARASPIVERVAIGTFDLALDLRLLAVDDPDQSELMWHIRSQIVIESRRLGLGPPVDGVYGRPSDEEGLRTACARAHRMGFAAKLLIHPKQIAVTRAEFGIAPNDLAEAKRIVAAYGQALASGIGAITVNGRLVDRPVFERARVLLDLAGEMNRGE